MSNLTGCLPGSRHLLGASGRLKKKSGASDVQAVELSVAIKMVLIKWKKLKINLEDVARLRWIEKMKLAEICNALGKSRSTVQVSIRTLRKAGVSQTNFSNSEMKLIENAIFEEIQKYGVKIQG